MKKLLSVIPVAAMFGILAFLFIFMCLPQNKNGADAVVAVDLYFLRTRGLYCAVLGGILITAFYHLSLYIFRRRESAYLLFSIFCLASVMQFLFARGGLNEVFHWIPAGIFLTRLGGLLKFLYHFAITVLVLYVFSRRFLLTHRPAFAAYFVFGISYMLIMPDAPLFSGISTAFIIGVSMFVTVMTFISPALRENRWTWLYFMSLILFLCTGFLQNVLLSGLFLPGLLSNLFMVLSQSILLSKNYTNAFRLVEETNENLERIVDERTKDLQNTNTAMKELVGNISHDLKTPLAVMSVNLEELSNLSQTHSDKDYQRCVRAAYQKNLDLQRLIQNLMEISRIETGQSLLRPDAISLSELLSEAQDRYDDYLRSHDIFFEIYYTGNAEIYADPQRIWSVFDNVIYNAARHTGKAGTVTISAAVLEKTAVVTITDTGCGIGPEHLPHIFERFYKVSASRSANAGESGLGLYIVKSVMEGCGGTATAESETGKGTSIILSFAKKSD